MALLILAGMGVMLTAPHAFAHAAILSTEPVAGSELTAAPGVVLLRFTEPLNVALSSASVTDPDGRRFEAEAQSEGEILVPVRSNAPGVYRVDWVTVSTLDGHTLRGAFRFGVGVSPGAGAEGGVELSPRPVDVALALARFIEYVALFAAIGILLVRGLARRAPAINWVNPPLRLAVTLALSSGLLVIVGEVVATDAPPALFWSYLATGPAGVARLTRLLAEGLAVAAVVTAPRLVSPALLASLVSLAWAGHAAAVRPPWLGISADAVHLAAAGLWAGGILAMATLRPPGGWRGPEGRGLMARFSPVAVPAFLATVGFGLVRGGQELRGWSDLVGTSYGRVLTIKVALVFVMIPLSVLAWRRVVGSIRAEAAVASLVIGAAALLAAFPLPPARLAEAEEATAGDPSSPALPRTGDLTLGGYAGEVLLGLTVRPGVPGPNRLLIYVLPLGGEPKAAELTVSLSVAGLSIETTSCSATCRAAEARLRGGEPVSVEVLGRRGGTAAFRIPSLPAPDGAAVLRRMQDRMHRLTTYRLEEILRPADPPLRASYAFQAPDRMRMELSTGTETVLIGTTRYSREGPTALWRRDSALRLTVPFFIWDNRRLVSPRVLGTETLTGVPTDVISFFGPSGSTPIWFRLWIDRTGLVRKAQMRANGHFMDHRYAAFDAPLEIRAPPTGAGTA